MILLTVVAVAVALLAYAELQRVAQGRLFLFAMPWDAGASRVELIDAKRSAETYLPGAILAISAVGLLTVYLSQITRPDAKSNKVSKLLLAMFVVSVAADLASTLWFFHANGIDHEVHPAIRLFGYAYGRTVGPILGKLLQATGLLLLALWLPRYGSSIILAATCLYLAAAVYNATV
jgi:hypothetical protein